MPRGFFFLTVLGVGPSTLVHTDQFPAEPHPSLKVYCFPVIFLCVCMCAHVHAHIYMEEVRGQIVGSQAFQQYSDHWVGTAVLSY